MTSLKTNEESNDLFQPLIIPNSSQEETKATDSNFTNTQLPKIPSKIYQNSNPDHFSLIDAPSNSESLINKFQNPNTNYLLVKKNHSASQKLPYLILHQENQGEALPAQKTPPFVLAKYLGPFIPPEGAQGINVDRLMPYLEFVTTLYEESFKKLRFNLYLVWLCLYPVLTIGLMTTTFIYFKPSWDPLKGSIAALTIISWIYSIYQAYMMYRIIKKKYKNGISSIIMLMTVYLMVGILIVVYFWLQDTPSDKERAQDLQNLISSHLSALVVHNLLTLLPAFWVRNKIMKFHRFIFLKNNLQDPEKTGIYYQHVFELLFMISEKGLLYPIKAPKNDEKKEIRRGIIKAFAEGFESITHE